MEADCMLMTSLAQRKTRRVKLQIATCCEGAVLGICASRTAVSPVLPIKCGDGLEEKKERAAF